MRSLKYQIYRFRYRFAKYLPLGAPIDVSLELASACNMKCNYCYHAEPSKLPFSRGIMSFEVAEKILNNAAELGVHSVKTNWKGESTLNPHFERITAHAKSLASGFTFIDRITNSNFKFSSTRDDIFRGLANQTKVKVSFDSFKPDVFNRQRAGGNHSITLANIDKFYNWPGRKSELIIQAVRTKLNESEDIEGTVRKLWPDAQVSIRDMVSGRVEKDVSDFEHRERDSSQRQACVQAFARLIFNWEGKAFPCCPDVGEHLELGDIRHEDIESIWRSCDREVLLAELRSGLAFEDDPCRSCSSFETFKGFKPRWDS